MSLSEDLARRVRVAAGEHNDDAEPITLIVSKMAARIDELEHAIRDVEITLCNDAYDVRVDNALATLRDVMEER